MAASVLLLILHVPEAGKALVPGAGEKQSSQREAGDELWVTDRFAGIADVVFGVTWAKEHAAGRKKLEVILIQWPVVSFSGSG